MFSWRAGANSQRMDRPAQFVRQNIHDAALALKARQTLKPCGDDNDAKMCFTFRSRTGMARVQIGFVNYLKMVWRKGSDQFFFDLVSLLPHHFSRFRLAVSRL